MRRRDIQPGAEVYYAPGEFWRVHSPIKAVIVDGKAVRIVRSRAGAFTAVSWVPDPSGRALVVDLREASTVRRTAVPVRHLRGLWAEMLAATGRTEAGVLAHEEAIRAIGRSRRPLVDDDLLRLAAPDPGVDDEVFGVLRRVAEEVDHG